MVADPPAFTDPTPPNRAHQTVPHVDGATWPCHLRAAPSRTSPGSAIKSQNPSFEGPAPRDRLLRRGIIPPGRAGKRRAGFTRRLLALHVAGLSGWKTASLPTLPATEPQENQGLYLVCCWTSSFILHTPQIPLEEGFPQMVHGTELATSPPLESFDEICSGKADDLPEQAFLYVGTLDDVRARAKEMAK